MIQPLSPAPIYTQFFPSPLPPRDVSRLEKWNKFYVLKFLIGLKLAVQMVPAGQPHQLVTILINALLKLGFPRYGPIDRYRLTTKTVISKIISDIIPNPENDNYDNESLGGEFYRDILETILIYNEHQFPSIGIGNDNKMLTHTQIWQLGLMQELNAENPSTYTRIGAIKQLIYVEFLKKQFGSNYDDFAKDICAYTGISSILDIALLFIHIQIAYEQAVKEVLPKVLIGPEDPRYELLHKLELVIDASSPGLKVNAAQLFTSPFIKLKDQNLHLHGTSDFDLITTKSWDHYLVKNKLFTKVLPKVDKIHHLKGEWGKPYVESFLGLRIFQSLEKSGIRVLPSDDKNRPDVTLIINEKDVFMIEIKSSAIDYKIISSQNVNDFQGFIDKNFATGIKGVPQLKRNIEYLSRHAESIFKIANPAKKLRIYPIIIYTEPHLTKQAVNDYVNTAATDLPPSVRSLFQSVEKVTLIPMDFFIENLSLFQKDRSLLRKLVSEYHAYVQRMKTSSAKSNNYANHLKAMISFEAWSIGKYYMYQVDKMEIFDSLRAIYEINS